MTTRLIRDAADDHAPAALTHVPDGGSLKERLQRGLELVNRLQVYDDDTLAEAERIVLATKKIEIAAHELYDDVCASTHRAWKAATGARKVLLDLGEQIKRIAARKAANHRRERQEATQRALEQAAAAAQTPEALMQAVEAAAVEEVAPPPPAALSYRTVRKWEVTDESLVPRALCSPDAAKIRQAVEGAAVVVEDAIPGVRIWTEDIPVRR